MPEFTALDERFAHQIPEPFPNTVQFHPDWRESLFHHMHPKDRPGDVVILTLAHFPARKLMDSLQLGRVGDVPTIAHHERAVNGDQDLFKVGPVTIDVEEPLKRIRLRVDDVAEAAVAMDLTFTARTQPYCLRRGTMKAGHDLVWDQSHMFQSGRYDGWYRHNGTTYEVTDWIGQRDHSWGIRSEMRTDETHPPLTYYPPFLYTWTTAQFKNRGLHIFFKERAPGDKIYISGEEVFNTGNRISSRNQITDVSHNLIWHDDPLGQSLASGDLNLTFADGRKKLITIKTYPVKYFLKGGLYGGLNGWFHGDFKGKFYSEHETWDLTEANTRKMVRTLADQIIEVKDGDEIGYGIMEYGVGKGYAEYASVQNHPPI